MLSRSAVRELRSERERERERERDRERKTEVVSPLIVGLKLAMSSHFPLPKIWTLCSTTLKFLPLCRKSTMSAHFLLPKNALFLPPFSNDATSDRRTENNWSNWRLHAQRPSHRKKKNKGIRLIPKTIGIRKTIVPDVTRGDKHYLRKSADRKAQISMRSFHSLDWFCALRSADCHGLGVYHLE